MGTLAILVVIVILWLPVAASTQGGITVEKTADRRSVRLGQTITYTITVTNNGQSATVRVEDTIPWATTYIAGSASSSRPPDPAYSNGEVSWSGTLNSGESVVITFQVRVAQPTTAGPVCFTNTARAQAAGGPWVSDEYECCAYGPTPTPTPWPRPPGVIPEPSTLALLGGGLATLLSARRLRARRR